MLDQTALEVKLEKLEDKLEPDFVKEVRKLSKEALEDKVFEYAQNLEKLEDEKKAHQEYQAAKSVIKDLNKGFNETAKFSKLRMKFVLAVMAEKGMDETV